jgi:hypothetical protein
MSIKKELLNELTEIQLKQFAEIKGVDFVLNTIQQQYYKDWEEKDKLVDLINDQKHISIADIEKFIVEKKE